MCGILGLVCNIKSEDVAWIKTASSRLSHRGPDATHIWVAPERNAIFAHNRLSVIDINSGSDQPFSSSCGELVIVFNGEIYNYIELREELILEGESFRTNGDTEVLLASYRRWGFD